MTRVHDMGGRFGDGPVDPDGGPLFAEEWHRRALGLTLAAGATGHWNIDASRHARESLRPTDYARFSYYEKWIAAVADLAVERGLLSRGDLRRGNTGVCPPAAEVLVASEVAGSLARGSPTNRDGPAPRHAPGDRVVTRRPARNLHVRGGHTRLPDYAAGHIGRILLCHGAHVFPDSNAHFLGEAAEPLYTVVFDAAEIWGEAERAGDEVLVDLWESYLEAVP